jgi:hypothetical protein
MRAVAAKLAAAIVLLMLALVPAAYGQAAAGAVAGNAGAFAGVRDVRFLFPTLPLHHRTRLCRC